MALQLMYITNRPEVARIAEDAGVDRIFVDMEYIGKAARQGGMDTVQNHHTIDDVKRIRDTITQSKLLVRCNPIHEETAAYPSSEEEINGIIEAGADIVMLPYFKTAEEVERFIRIVDGRAIIFPLLETPEAVEHLTDILRLKKIDEIHIGLNDLSLGYHRKFMFELLADGTVDSIVNQIRESRIPYGFGGIARIGNGLIPAEMIIKEHYRLDSQFAILSRSFCNANAEIDALNVEYIFHQGVSDIRNLEEECMFHRNTSDKKYFTNNKTQLINKVQYAVKLIEQDGVNH